LAWIKRRPLVWFFVLSYAISWPAWVLEVQGFRWASFPGYFGPAIAAIIIVALTQGRDAVEDLFARILRWRVSFRWYLAATVLPLIIILLVIPIQLVIDPSARFDPQTILPSLPRLLLLLIGGTLLGTLITAGEEIGWRGYALPEYLKRHQPLPASLLVGIFWGFWHLPLIWLFYTGQFNLLNALLYALGFMAASVFYTWLHINTGGSVLIASLFHSVYDMVAMLAGGLSGNLFSFRVHMLVWIVAAIILAALNGWLSKEKQITTHP
jgi:membrane protease YdiL (CAAX protease family)